MINRPKTDIDIMAKMISKHIKTKEPIIIYNMTVYHDYRLTGYVIGNEDRYKEFGYAVFTIGKDYKYKLVDVIEPDKTTIITSDIVVYEFSKIEFGDYADKKLAIMNNSPNLSKVEVILENGETKIKEVNSTPSVIVFEDIDVNLELEYYLYGKNGDVIE